MGGSPRRRFRASTVGVLAMASQKSLLLSLLPAFLTCGLSAPILAGENVADQWDKSRAAQYLDGRGENWFKFSGANRGEGASASHCVSCHTLLPISLARPVLRRLSNQKSPTELETKILQQTRSRVANWDQLEEVEYQLFYDFDEAKKKQSRGTEAVLNALLLSLDDRFEGRQQPGDDTKKALAILWATQITEGEHKGSWEWLNFGLQPWESADSRYLGATLAAIALGAAPGNGVGGNERDVRKGLDALRSYLTSHYAAQNLHNRAWLLWASSGLDGLLTAHQKEQLTEQLLAKQQAGGGWSLGALGDFTHVEIKTPSTVPDGYATGLVLHSLQLGGLPKDHPQVSKGLSWLRSNQDPTGAWRATSVNKPREPESKNAAKANIGKFMWDAATGYSVLALSH
jgi:squalene-hopene/tetraprenyl-beta-curcumene cyclase